MPDFSLLCVKSKLNQIILTLTLGCLMINGIFVALCSGCVGLWITTECGRLQVSPGEIAVLPQGFRFAVDLPDGPSRGYVAEVFGTHFQLPDLGPIGM